MKKQNEKEVKLKRSNKALVRHFQNRWPDKITLVAEYEHHILLRAHFLDVGNAYTFCVSRANIRCGKDEILPV